MLEPCNMIAGCTVLYRTKIAVKENEILVRYE